MNGHLARHVRTAFRARRDGSPPRRSDHARCVAPSIVALWTGVIAGLLLNCHATRADEPVSPPAEEVYLLDSAGGLLAADHAAKFLGPRSCAATACHGGTDPDPRFPLSQRNEYASWLDHDPHARAHLTLANEKSQLILARLARADDDPRVQARRLANCYGCHNPQPAKAQQGDTYFSRDGVSCEICHGAAERWIGAHVEVDWRDRKVRDGDGWRARARELGFVDTEDLVVRGQTCAQCHVGSPGREVNHDLIAAGHPVLKFEFAAYHELLPKHWRADQQRQADPQFDVKLWSAGQVAAADAALALTDWRASTVADKHPDATWPELAEYDCFDCHHDLEDPSWRRQRSAAGLPLGVPAWGTWYFGPLRQINEATDGFGQSLATLTDHMQQGFGQDRKKVRDAVSVAREQLARWQETESLARVGRQMRLALDKLVMAHGKPETGNRTPPTGWDEAVQLYLAIVALDEAARAIDAASFATTRELFSFPENFNSPRGFFGQRKPGTLPNHDGAATTHQRSRQQIVAALIELIQQLEPPKD